MTRNYLTYCLAAICGVFALLVRGSQGADHLQGYYMEEEIRIFSPMDHRDRIVIRKSWYAGDRMLKDEDFLGTTIARFDQGRIFFLEPQEKTYIELSQEFLRENAGQGFADFGLRDEAGEVYFPDDLYVRTESSREIGPWQCYQVVTNPKYRTPEGTYAVIWYSTDVDFPMEVYVGQMKRLFGQAPEVEAFFTRLQQFEGYPVRTEAHGMLNTFTTLMKVEYQTDIDPGIFEIPAEYSKAPLPEYNSGDPGSE